MSASDTATALLEELGIKSPPVPVERVAKNLGARLVFQPFEGNISGMLYRDGAQIVIGVNSAHAEVRQRFTIAHEIAHLKLHRGRPMILDHIVRVDFRDDRSSRATDREEIQANKFAADLLMPASWLGGEIVRRSTIHVEDETLFNELAQTFGVSRQAIEYRLANLGLSQQL